MVYAFLRIVASTIFKYFYRKIEYSGFENIPKDKPVFLACNHPGGFIEPCILACISKRPFYFLVRGDLFAKQPLRWFLEQTNEIPIFRQKDGRNNMEKNKSSFRYVNKMLALNKAIMIFSEGSTEDMKYLRPLKKGLARMAYNAWEDGLDVHIVPIGITFSKQSSMRSDVFTRIGEPIRIADYIERFETNLNQGVKDLYYDLSERMKANMVAVDNTEDFRLLDEGLSLLREENPDSRFPLWDKSEKKLIMEKSFSDTLNAMNETEKESLKTQLLNLKALKKKWNVLPAYYNKDLNFIQQFLVLVVGAVPALLGYLFHLIPGMINLAVAKKAAPKKIYYAPILFVGCSIWFPLYYTILIIIFLFINAKLLFILLITPFLGLWFFLYREWLHTIPWQWRRNRLNLDQKAQLKAIRSTIQI